MKKVLILLFLGLIAPTTFALTLPTDVAGQALDAALATVMGNLETVALKLLFSLSLLQFCITGFGLYQSGEIDASLGKFAKFITWVGFCVWLLSPSGNADGLSVSGHFIKSSVDGFMTLAGSWTATQGSSFSTSDIMMTGLVAYGNITLSVAKVTATNAVNAAMALFVPGVALFTLMMTFAISVIVLVSCAYIALKVFMVKLELGIVVAMAPLSISLLGLQGLREQGFAPFKSMLALIYRTVVLGATVAAMSAVSKFLSDYVNAQAFGISADVWGPLIGAAFGYVILAFVAHKSDAIASSLSSGSAGLGTGDVASAAAIGAAVGAAVMTGGASVAAGAAKIPESMGDFMKNLGGGGGSVSNASPSGAGASPVGEAPKPPTSPPAMFSTRRDGAPIAPSGASPAANKSKTGPDLNTTPPSPPSTSAGAGSGQSAANVKAAQDLEPQTPSPSSTGAGENAGIGGAGNKPQENPGSQNAPKQPLLKDRLAEANRLMAQENSTTHVSINTNSD